MSSMASNRLVLFVGNLPWTVSNKALRDYFQHYGRVYAASVIFNERTGMSRSFGFVEYKNKEAFDNAMSQEAHWLENSKLIVKPRKERVLE